MRLYQTALSNHFHDLAYSATELGLFMADATAIHPINDEYSYHDVMATVADTSIESDPEVNALVNRAPGVVGRFLRALLDPIKCEQLRTLTKAQKAGRLAKRLTTSQAVAEMLGEDLDGVDIMQATEDYLKGED